VEAAADEPIASRLRGRWKGSGGDLTKELMTWKELRAIPGELEQLRAYLEERITRQTKRYSEIDLEKEMLPRLREACMQIVGGLPVSPEARASAYRILTSLPGMRAEGQVTDPLGQRGQALSYQVEGSPGQITDIRFMIDSSTGLPLAEVTTTSGELANGQQVEIRYSTSYQAIGWTDERPELPAHRD
jgi:hypothetical protein